MDITVIASAASALAAGFGVWVRARYRHRQLTAKLEAEVAKRDAAKDDSDTQFARQLLREELARERAEVAALRAEVKALHAELNAMRAEISSTRYSHENLTQQLRTTNASLDEMTEDRDAWKERAAELGAKLVDRSRENGVTLKEPTGRFKPVKP